MTLVIATGGIDLSVGSLMAIAGAVAPIIFLSPFGVDHPALGVVLALAVAGPVAGLFGTFNGWFITRFRVQPIVGTLVLFIAGRGIGAGDDERQPAGLQEPPLPVHRARPRPGRSRAR